MVALSHLTEMLMVVVLRLSIVHLHHMLDFAIKVILYIPVIILTAKNLINLVDLP